MATTDHAHDLKVSQGRRGGLHPLEAAGRLDHSLERAVIRPYDVVQILRGPVLDTLRQQPFTLSASDGLGYDANPSAMMEGSRSSP